MTSVSLKVRKIQTHCSIHTTSCSTQWLVVGHSCFRAQSRHSICSHRDTSCCLQVHATPNVNNIQKYKYSLTTSREMQLESSNRIDRKVRVRPRLERCVRLEVQIRGELVRIEHVERSPLRQKYSGRNTKWRRDWSL